MAYFSGTFLSESMSRPVHFTAVLSNDNSFEIEQNAHYKRNAKTVYLLHGYSGCDTDWLLNAPLQELANRFNVNFFMPNGDNSFYLDQPQTGFKYCTYVGQEFVDYTRKTFNLSGEREDTMIAGLSMGGFGAIHTGLTYPRTFSRIMAYSSALIIDSLDKMTPDSPDLLANFEYYNLIFGDLSTAAQTDINPVILAKRLIESGSDIPKIYMSCGTEDFLFEENNRFKKALDDLGVAVDYHTSPGIHDFVFWRNALEASLEWAL